VEALFATILAVGWVVSRVDAAGVVVVAAVVDNDRTVGIVCGGIVVGVVVVVGSNGGVGVGVVVCVVVVGGGGARQQIKLLSVRTIPVHCQITGCLVLRTYNFTVKLRDKFNIEVHSLFPSTKFNALKLRSV